MRISSLVLRVIGVQILPCRVRLPQFKHCVRHWNAIAIEHSAVQPDPLSFGFRSRQTTHRMCAGAQVEKRPDSL
jgi:hypothetical protein